MSDVTEMMLDGTLCSVCGQWMGICEGYPVTCRECGGQHQPMSPPNFKKYRKTVKCPQCQRKISRVGLADHVRDVHGEGVDLRVVDECANALPPKEQGDE